MTVHAVDPAPLAGDWVNFDTAATGIGLVDATVDGGRLMLRITERGDPKPSQEALEPPATPVTGATLPAVPLADDIDATEAIAFLAEGPLGSRQVILVGYLNRGLLTIDVHTVHPTDTRMPNVMYRAHFYRLEGATPVGRGHTGTTGDLPRAVGSARNPAIGDVQAVLGTVAKLAADRFAPRAEEYDRKAVFPTEDFDDLFSSGLLGVTVPREYGGLGYGPQQRNALPLWEMTTTLAKADLSLARCWEGHANSLVLVDALATAEQKRRWFAGVVEHGEKWAAWSGEPQAPKPGESVRFGTTLAPVQDGWTLNGSKAFATGATGAQWAILLVDPDGAGGARGTRDVRRRLLLLACDLSDPTVTVDSSWWDPIGMRATVSHSVRFQDTFIPREHLIGDPGSYFDGQWQSAFIPHYAASFLGGALAAYEYGLAYLKRQGKGGDPYVQQRVGSMSVNAETARLWLRHVASLWDEGRLDEARIAGDRAWHVIAQLTQELVHHAIHACGARSLIRPSPVERILRDLTLYQLHDNSDHVLATIGRVVLGEQYDPSFHQL